MPLPEPEVPATPYVPNATTADREAYSDVALIYREFCAMVGQSFPLRVSRIMQRDMREAGADAALIAAVDAALAKAARIVERDRPAQTFEQNQSIFQAARDRRERRQARQCAQGVQS